MIRVLLADSLNDDAERRLAKSCEIVRPPATDPQTLVRFVSDCDALIVRSNHDVTRGVLEAGLPRLRVVGVAAVGTDRIDVDAAHELGVAVLNRAAAASDAVAEFTIGLMLHLLRPIANLAAEYQAGRFDAARTRPHGRELCGLTIGIVGMGRIGSRVARLCAAGFGARVRYNDIVALGPFSFSAEPAEKHLIWANCDVVSLHVPLTQATRRLVNADVLQVMKPGALLINTCRGPVVDTAALTAAMLSGRLGGAALDVTEPEPLPADHALLRLPNCIVTPHVASRTFAGMEGMFGIVDDVIEHLRRL